MGSISEQKVAIVTGASSGMGEAITRELVGRGWYVAMADIRPNAALSHDLGTNATFYETDVASYDSQAATSSSIFEDRGRIDCLCANAGISDRSSLYILNHRGKSSVPPAPDMTCTDINWKGFVYGVQLGVNFMRQNPRAPGGVIVATASIAAVHPHPSYAEYNGTKAAILNFVRGSAGVLKVKDNVRLNCVLPGIVPTAIVPPQFLAAVDQEDLTPLSTIVKAYMRLIEGDETGQGIEASVDKLLAFSEPPMLNGQHTKRAVTVWDPLFKVMHGENSGLPDTIAGEDFQLK
ncbi:hypothetical protein LTR62_005831 [Meristemomyces frigidus]|uniref:Uncharacterized protein n=1 Tax=Meristemomyces frigidus TaxID=1508187 RepID=A0AAN7TP27_9PEZI|nr:hypothetical protein LTR62_005831 [Meristemomyces frigidus]